MKGYVEVFVLEAGRVLDFDKYRFSHMAE